MKRPFFTFRLGRDWSRNRGLCSVLIVAPYPAAEQEPGHLTRALINAAFYLTWGTGVPRLWAHVYTPRRDRLGEAE